MSPSLHDLADAASRVAVAFQAAPPGVSRRVWQQLHPWVQRLLINASGKWLPRATAAIPCEVPLYRGGVPMGPCTNHALCTCDVCGKSACLDHCRVDQFGDAICYLCVIDAIQSRAASGQPGPADRGPAGWERDDVYEQRHAPGNGAGRRPPAPDEAAVRAAYRMLGVKRSATGEELRSALKAKLGRWHPDKFKSDAQKARAEQRFKEIQAAFEVIERSRREAA